MRRIDVLLMLLATGCSKEKPVCTELACKPSWSGNCYCYAGAKVEQLPSGIIVCRCPK